MATSTAIVETITNDIDKEVALPSPTVPSSPNTPNSPHSPSQSIELQTLNTLDRNLEAPPDAASAFPDGGLRAWLVVLGAFAILGSTFGLMTSVGVLQAYWSQNQLASYTDSEIGWIPSIFVFLSLFLGVQFGPLFDRYGPRWINLIASGMYVVCLVVLAECETYWQFMLTLGVLGGICCAALSTTGLAVLSHWFQTRRGLATGVAMAGSSCGGVAFPLLLRPALDSLGWKWTMRLLALVVLVFTMVANLFIKGRLPLGRRSGSMDPRCLKDARLAWVTLGTFCLEFTLFGALGLLPTFTLTQGFSNETSFIVIAVLNAGSALGRYGSGIVSDKWGHYNTMNVMITFSLVVMTAVWFSVGYRLVVLYVFAALFGIFTGGFISLAPPCVGYICDADRFGEVFGTCYGVVSFATLLTIPIGGQVLKSAGPEALIGVLSVSVGIALFSYLMARWACLGYRWKWATKI
ncbi:MAG: hypothetical protein M1820_001139 [Bogoriella megaspora]|nr:MAG: hypothetical protein M1820_001139 [Bogoriella megaspora]